MTRNFVATSTCLIVLVATTGCGYRIVKRSDVTAQRFAADSATMTSLERQIDALRAQSRADSLRMASELAARRSAPINLMPATPDSLLKARDVEITTLKDQLARALAELDRIKRRLANPRS
ncbi:MAG: hypothetical protein ACR2MQ_10620 [Gemmatimonadaceae bacterium]